MVYVPSLGRGKNLRKAVEEICLAIGEMVATREERTLTHKDLPKILNIVEKYLEPLDPLEKQDLVEHVETSVICLWNGEYIEPFPHDMELFEVSVTDILFNSTWFQKLKKEEVV